MDDDEARAAMTNLMRQVMMASCKATLAQVDEYAPHFADEALAIGRAARGPQ